MRQLRELAGGTPFDPDAISEDPLEDPECVLQIFWPCIPLLDDGNDAPQ
jgi:hypothetical protein